MFLDADMNVILIEPNELNARNEVTLEDRRAEHIVQVLQGVEGQSLRIGRIDGPLGTGMIRAVGKATVTLRCLFNSEPPPRPLVDLLLALPRPKVMKRLWAPLASLGIGHIHLTNAQRVERYYFDSHVLEPDFVRLQLLEGLAQAMDTRVPQVSIHKQFKPLLEDQLDALAGDSLRIAADPAATQRVHQAVGNQPDQQRVLLAIGPEGGWTEFELQLLKQHRFELVTTGHRILRSDTACTALITLVYDALQ
jgi:16S rRNA (uracil1498-N3)-methyltransferase